MHAVRNTGIEGVVQYCMVDCACACNKVVDKVKISKWFKPIHGSGVGAASGDLMEFGDKDECEINCDPDESDDSDETSSDK